NLPKVDSCPIAPTAAVTKRGVVLKLPLAANEMVYGLGLQLQSVSQRNTKKKLRVNADPKMDTGDSHAPVPFYVTTAGYGVLVDTARYATFYCGGSRRNGVQSPSKVTIEVPEAQGVDVYIFAGPTMREAVQRYN